MIECLICRYESAICQINFYHRKELLVKTGWTDKQIKEYHNNLGRREIFQIADDEQLIGCQLDEGLIRGVNRFIGVTWLKMKTLK